MKVTKVMGAALGIVLALPGCPGNVLEFDSVSAGGRTPRGGDAFPAAVDAESQRPHAGRGGSSGAEAGDETVPGGHVPSDAQDSEQGHEAISGHVPSDAQDSEQGHEVTMRCAQPACSESRAELEDDSRATLEKSGVECVLAGLVTRTPGLFIHTAISISARGTESTEYAYLVLKDGSALHSAKRTASGGQFALRGEEGTFYTALERCLLAPVDYFDDCHQAVQVSSTPTLNELSWVCAYEGPVDSWVTDCEPAEPQCE